MKMQLLEREYLPVVVLVTSVIAVTIAIPVVGVSATIVVVILVLVLVLVLMHALPQLSSVSRLENDHLRLNIRSVHTEQCSCPCNGRTQRVYMPEGQPRIQRPFYGVQGLVGEIRRRMG